MKQSFLLRTYLRIMHEMAITALMILLILPLPSKSQQVLDLGDCITAGLERNFNILIARNEEQTAINNATPGNAGYLPEVTLTNRFGGTINSTDQTLSDSGKSTSKGIHNTTGTAGLNLGITIFRGFRVQTTYRKLQELKAMGELNTQMTMENLVSKIAAEYYFYIEQLNLYKNLAYAVTLSRERVRIDEQRYLLGASSKLDLLQSIVYFNADSSRLAKQNEVLHASQVRLNELMASEDPGQDILPHDTIINFNENLQFRELLEATLRDNTSLQIAAKSQVISEMDYKIISSQSYPYLTASSGYTYNAYGYENSDLRNQQVRGMNYGLTLGMDLFDGFNRKREKNNARIEVENRQYQFKELEQEVKADLITMFYGYENNLRLLKLEEQNLAVARENLEIALERYKLGSLAGLELREVQKSLLDAEERLISVKYLTKIAEISLFQISGKIMDYV